MQGFRQPAFALAQLEQISLTVAVEAHTKIGYGEDLLAVCPVLTLKFGPKAPNLQPMGPRESDGVLSQSAAVRCAAPHLPWAVGTWQMRP